MRRQSTSKAKPFNLAWTEQQRTEPEKNTGARLGRRAPETRDKSRLAASALDGICRRHFPWWRSRVWVRQGKGQYPAYDGVSSSSPHFGLSSSNMSLSRSPALHKQTACYISATPTRWGNVRFGTWQLLAASFHAFVRFFQRESQCRCQFGHVKVTDASVLHAIGDETCWTFWVVHFPSLLVVALERGDVWHKNLTLLIWWKQCNLLISTPFFAPNLRKPTNFFF